MGLWEKIYKKHEGRYGDLVDAYVELYKINKKKERELCKTKNGTLDGNVSGTRNQKKQKNKNSIR